jgi:hypothetical protein
MAICPDSGAFSNPRNDWRSGADRENRSVMMTDYEEFGFPPFSPVVENGTKLLSGGILLWICIIRTLKQYVK